MLKNKKNNRQVIMAEYAMALKNGKDIVHRTNQQTLEEAKKYFQVSIDYFDN